MRGLSVVICALGLAACGKVLDQPSSVDAPCADTDADGVCDAEDRCAAGPDTLDADGDQVADACDRCSGFDDRADADSDTVPDGCDDCAGFDDRTDVNGNTIPDGCDLQVAMVDLKAVTGNYWRGWHQATLHTNTNDNTLTGVSGGVYNSYFVFPLPVLAVFSIVSVTFELELEEYTTADATETLSIWDVSTAPALVESSPGSQAIFDDLMTGNQYATYTQTIDPLQKGMIQTIPLSAQAAIDVRAKLGEDFAVGVHLDTAPGWVRFGSAEPRVARLVLRYLPPAP